jgi:hypothetical protein
MGRDFEPLSAAIIEAAIAVDRAPGPGFLESIKLNARALVVKRIVLG